MKKLLTYILLFFVALVALFVVISALLATVNQIFINSYDGATFSNSRKESIDNAYLMPHNHKGSNNFENIPLDKVLPVFPSDLPNFNSPFKW